MNPFKYINVLFLQYLESTFSHYSIFSILVAITFISTFIFTLLMLKKDSKIQSEMKPTIQKTRNGFIIYAAYSVIIKLMVSIKIEGTFFLLFLTLLILIDLILVSSVEYIFFKTLFLLKGKTMGIAVAPFMIIGGIAFFIFTFWVPYAVFNFSENINGDQGVFIYGLFYFGMYLIIFLPIVFSIVKKMSPYIKKNWD